MELAEAATAFESYLDGFLLWKEIGKGLEEGEKKKKKKARIWKWTGRRDYLKELG